MKQFTFSVAWLAMLAGFMMFGMFAHRICEYGVEHGGWSLAVVPTWAWWALAGVAYTAAGMAACYYMGKNGVMPWTCSEHWDGDSWMPWGGFWYSVAMLLGPVSLFLVLGFFAARLGRTHGKEKRL